MAFQFWRYTVDDAFISFRYARNLVHGWGLVFNQGERVEGYTNFLWVLLTAIPEMFGFSTEMFAKVVGLVCSVGTLVVISWPTNGLSPAVRWIPAAFLATSPSFVVWSVSGLETALFGLLLTLGILRVAWSAENGKTDQVAAVLLALACLARPEGVLIVTTVAAIYSVLALRRVLAWSSWLKWCLTVLAIFLPYYLWRYAYYGYPLPNTFYAKVGFGGSQFSRGLLYLKSFILASGFWTIGWILGLRWNRRPRFSAIIGSTLVVFITYIVLVGGDGLPMYRFFAPIVGLLYLLLLGLGVDGFFKRWGERNWAMRAGVTVLAISFFWNAHAAVFGPGYRSVQKDIKEIWTWKVIGGWFRQNAARSESLAVIPAGALPYYSELRSLDMLGLNDVAIAHRTMENLGAGRAGHEKYDVAHVLDWKPTYVLVGVYRLYRQLMPPEEMIWPYYPAETALLDSKEFKNAYELRSASVAGGHFYFYVRRDRASPAAPNGRSVKLP